MNAAARILLFATVLLLGSLATNAQADFGNRGLVVLLPLQDRILLRQAMLDYIDAEVIREHCYYGPLYNVEGDWSFLPFHRVYLEGMEDYLWSLGPPYRNWVPLPKWAPDTYLQPNLRAIDLECPTTDCSFFGGPSYACDQPQTWDTQIGRPAYLELPEQPGSLNDLCDFNLEPGWPDISNGGNCCPDGLSRWIETFHTDVEDFVANGQLPGGVMRWPRAPAALGFWFFHAYVDDLWKDWETNCPQSTMEPIDLYIKDTPKVYENERDRGEEPNIDQGPMWVSEDIWIRRQDDGILNQEHQNPDHFTTPGQTNYVYVRVRNRGSQASTGSEQLTLNWAKASTALSWPSHWNGSIPLMGSQIDVTRTLPAIPPGGSHIEVFSWNAPDPQVYATAYADGNALLLADQPWHFCMLARIQTAPGPDYGMTYPETELVGQNAQYNNNIAWKNISVIDIAGVTGGGQWPNDKVVGATVLVGDCFGTGGSYDLVFKNPDTYKGNPITEEAEIRVTIEEDLWDAWQNAGGQMVNMSISREDRYQLIVTGNPARLKNIPIEANARFLTHVSFNFLADQLSGQTIFDYDLIQKDAANQSVGGERYHIVVPGRPGFYADAGPDKKISPNTAVDLNANAISEAAIYNWYDPSGNLIETGSSLTVSPAVTTKYKLEVIAEIDGVKDYDLVEVKIKVHEITSLAPNPTSNTTEVYYRLTNATSAFLMLSMPGSTVSNQYLLNVDASQTQINVEGLPPGIYNLVLVVNGQVVDHRPLTVL